MSTKKLQIIGDLGTKIYTQNEEPTDVPDGTLWLDLDDESQSSSGAMQPDWNQTDDTQMNYIKNKPFSYGKMYIEDLVMPNPSELYCTISQEELVDTGYALLGYKTIFESGKTYTLEETITQGELSQTTQTSVTAYPASALGFTGLDDVMVLVDRNTKPYIISGAVLDLSTYPNIDPSTIVVTDDTMYLTYKIKTELLSYMLTCKGYNNVAQGYKTIDVNYLPMQQLNQIFQLKNELIKTEQIADSSISTRHLQESVIEGKHIKDAVIQSKHISNNAITEDNIATNAVTTDKICRLSVSGEKIIDDAISERHLCQSAVRTNHILDLAITSQKLAPNTITGDKIALGTIPRGCLEDYLLHEKNTVKQNVVSITNKPTVLIWSSTEGTYYFDIMSTDTQSTSQEVVISLIAEIEDTTGIYDKEIEIFRDALDFSGGKSIQFEVHVLKTNAKYVMGEVRVIGEFVSMIKPIMFHEILNYRIDHMCNSLPGVKIAFGDSLNQQIASGSQYWVMRQAGRRD